MKERESLLSGNTMLEILQEKIEQGHYPAGKRLPSERKLAAEFHVPQSQIHKKLQQLVESGLLECFRGNGYFGAPGETCRGKSSTKSHCAGSGMNPIALPRTSM